jgi:WS/DGAT/MGAT family acyltransferase
MDPMEAVMWRMDADPRLRGAIVSVELLDRIPGWERFWAAHEWGSHMVRRVRERVVEPTTGLGAPIWAVDPDFDLSNHVRRLRLAAPGDLRQLLDIAQEIAATPFEPGRPPWEAVLVEGYESDKAAYVLKMHHSATDGLGGTQLLELMHSRTAKPTYKGELAPAPAPERPSPFGLLAGRVLLAPLDAVRRVPSILSAGAELIRHPADAASGAAEYIGSLTRMLGSDVGPPSPLLASRSQARRYEILEVPLSELRAAAKAAGGSVNDAYLAAVCGGVGRYHRHFGIELARVPMGIPVSIRREGNPMGGNRFAGVRLPAPIGERDPVERIRQIRELVLTARSEPALDALHAVAPVMTALPTRVLVDLNLRVGRALDIQASNLPGIAHPVYLAGARVTRWYPFAPVPGVAAMIVMISHAGTCCVGIHLDPAAVTEPELFLSHLQEGFDEVIALGRATATA